MAIVVVGQGIQTISDKVVTGGLHLAWRSGDDRVRRYYGVLGNNGMSSDDAIVANDHPVHDGGINANQAIVSNRGAVNGAMMSNRAVRAYLGRHVGDVDHREVLNIGVLANLDMVGLCPHDNLGPNGHTFLEADITV